MSEDLHLFISQRNRDDNKSVEWHSWMLGAEGMPNRAETETKEILTETTKGARAERTEQQRNHTTRPRYRLRLPRWMSQPEE